MYTHLQEQTECSTTRLRHLLRWIDHISHMYVHMYIHMYMRIYIGLYLCEQKKIHYRETQALAALNELYHTYVHTFESKRGYSSWRHRHLLRWTCQCYAISHIYVYLGEPKRMCRQVTCMNTYIHTFTSKRGYRAAKIRKMPYLYRSFSAKEPYNWWLFCRKWPAT